MPCLPLCRHQIYAWLLLGLLFVVSIFTALTARHLLLMINPNRVHQS